MTTSDIQWAGALFSILCGAVILFLVGWNAVHDG